MKANVKKRRAERIRQLTLEDAAGPLLPEKTGRANNISAVRPKEPLSEMRETDQQEQDPELAWKQQGQGRWRESYDWYGTKDDENFPAKRPSFWRTLVVRFIISGIIFTAVWGIERYEPSWALPLRAFIVESLTEEMNFAAVEAWYEEHFGGPPSFIPIFKHHGDNGVKVGAAGGFTSPIPGSLAGTFALSLRGVEIIPESQGSNRIMQVRNVQTGRVLSVTQDALTGPTVTVQHADGYTSIYGHLAQITVEKGDWVEGGDVIGSLPPALESPLPTLYFALKKDDRYVDPADVIPFD